MFGSNVLEIAIGVVFVYLLISLVVTAVNEAIASLIDKRGKNLFEGIKNLLNDPQFTGLAQVLYTHGLVEGISQDASNSGKPNRLPSYMASGTFSLALIDILGSLGGPDAAEAQLNSATTQPPMAANILADIQAARDAFVLAQTTAAKVTGPKDLANIQAAAQQFEHALSLGRALIAEVPNPLDAIARGVAGLPDGHTKESLQVLIDKTKRETAAVAGQVAEFEHQVEMFGKNIETWFNTTMDRVAGWYKRWTQQVLLVLATIIVVGANVDTLVLVNTFARDGVLRASVVAAAEQVVESNNGRPVGSTSPLGPSAFDSTTGARPTHIDSVATPGPTHIDTTAIGGHAVSDCTAAPRPTHITDTTAIGGHAISDCTAAPRPTHSDSIALPGRSVNDCTAVSLPPSTISRVYSEAAKLDLPIGWSGPWAKPIKTMTIGDWLMKIAGLAISVFAISLGAPFWFDTLSRFINLRGAGKPPLKANTNDQSTAK